MSTKGRKPSVMSGGPGVPSDGRNALRVWLVNDNLSHLMGEVLTILDASVEGEKNIAMKSLIKRAFSDKQSWISRLGWAEKEEADSGHAPSQDWEHGLVPLEKPSKKYFFTLAKW